jgi:putative endonuclease
VKHIVVSIWAGSAHFDKLSAPPALLNHRLKQEIYMAWMYILECCDGSYYVGSTKNLERRLSEHQEGLGARYTTRRLPVKLVYSEEYDCVADAFYREKQVQGWSRAKREALIKGEYEKLPLLAKKKFEKKKAIDEQECG